MINKNIGNFHNWDNICNDILRNAEVSWLIDA